MQGQEGGGWGGSGLAPGRESLAALGVPVGEQAVVRSSEL
jgi:hypothetical protein